MAHAIDAPKPFALEMEHAAQIVAQALALVFASLQKVIERGLALIL
jgi:hypothetical protein